MRDAFVAIDAGELSSFDHRRVHVSTRSTLFAETHERLVMTVPALQRIILLKTLPFSLG